MASDYTSLLLFYYPDMTTLTLSFYNLCIVLRYYDAHWVPCSWSYTDTHVPRELSTTTALASDSRYTLSHHIPHPHPNTTTMEHGSTQRHIPSNSAANTGDYDPHTIPQNLVYFLDARQQPDISTPYSPRHTKRRHLWRIHSLLAHVDYWSPLHRGG